MLTTRDVFYFFDQYLSDDAQREDPRVAPARARSLAGLPPALVVVAGHDPLRDQGIDYADRLAAAGGRAELLRYDGAVHGFFTMPGLRCRDAAVAAAAAFLRHHLGS